MVTYADALDIGQSSMQWHLSLLFHVLTLRREHFYMSGHIKPSVIQYLFILTQDLPCGSCSVPDPLLLMPRGATWFRPNSLSVLFDILVKSQFKSVALVVGNTASGNIMKVVLRDLH
jgi:hypothetical protein